MTRDWHILTRGQRVKVIRAVLPKRQSPERAPTAPATPLDPIGPVAADVERILKGRTSFPQLLWSEVI